MNLSIFDPYYLTAIILVAALVGIEGERREWYGPVSGAIVTILLMALCTSIGLTPSASDPEQPVATYQFVYDFVVPFSIPMLLWYANLKKIFTTAGRLSILFLIGSLAIALGGLLAYSLLDLGPEGAKIAGVYVATYTGGSVNFMSVAKSLDFLQSSTFATVITIDNVFTTVFFMLLFAVPSIQWIASKYIPYQEEDEAPSGKTGSEESDKRPLLSNLALTLGIAALIVWISRVLDGWVVHLLDASMSFEVLIATVLSVGVTNIFASFFARLAETGFQLGMYLLYVFLAVIGAACDLPSLVQSSPILLLFVTITLVVHVVVLLIAGKLLKFSLEESLVASVANIGGPSISAAMASSFKMKSGVTPAILVGILGYVVGTFLGVGVGVLLQ
ncbi:MAG: DUF819 family protein [Saprospiraceae bacterium]|nr:DUF819 family protein [Saprospiraceae bacterium]